MNTEATTTRRRLYSDVLTTSPSSQTTSDVKQESTEQSPDRSPCNTEKFYIDSISRFLEGWTREWETQFDNKSKENTI